MRVLLTGGAGFIGSHVADALLRRGVDLQVLDNLDEFYSPVRKKANLEDIRRAGAFEFQQVDICDAAAISRAVSRFRPDVVVHLAARAGVRPSIEQPLLYEKVNVTGTLNLLEACRERKLQRFVFGSSSSVYGATSHVPFSEDQTDLRPISPYAATKLAGEMLCYSYAHLFRLPVVCLRFFTVYGPRQRPDLAIHKFVSLMERGKTIPIFGDGSTGRDYTYVDDIVAGVLAAIDFDFPAPIKVPFETFNLGNSQPVRLNELIERLEKITGQKANRKQEPEQAGDVPLTWADTSKAERLLGYRPQVGLEEGLRRFVSWYRSIYQMSRA